jgi:predicted RNA-binding Zn ribbon-like protein
MVYIRLVQLRMLAGHPALDFVNTIDPREGTRRVEYLHRHGDLVAWARKAGVLSGKMIGRVTRAAADDPAAAARAFTRAVALREALYAIFGAVVARRPVPANDMRKLQATYREAITQSRLVATGRRFQWQLTGGLDAVRAQIARDAVALLESEMLGRVRRCPGGGDCGWLFLDSSKNASRRWCSMEGCGNRAKRRRFLRRRKRATPATRGGKQRALR